MVNLNYSKEELAAVRAAAAHAGQKVYVIPPEDEIYDESAQAAKIRERVVRALQKKGKPDQLVGLIEDGLWTGSRALPADLKELGPLADQYKELFSHIRAKESKSPPVSEQIRSFVSELKARHEKIGNLVISGHSNGTTFSGETTVSLSSADFESLKKDRLSSDPRHVLLLGCYANSPISNQQWKEYFSNATLIGGFTGRSVLRTDPRSPKFITDTLNTAEDLETRKKNMAAVLTATDLKKVFSKSLDTVNAALSYCGKYLTRVPASANCKDDWVTMEHRAGEIDSAYFMLPGPNPAFDFSKDPPRDVGNSDLRKFYNDLQNLCPYPQGTGTLLLDAESRPGTIDKTIRLIFWWKIQPRFSLEHEAEIRSMKERLKAFPATANLNEVPNLNGDASRREFLKDYDSMLGALMRAQEETQAKLDAAQSSQPQPDAATLSSLQKAVKDADSLEQDFSALYDPLFQLDNRIPQTWL